MSLIILLYINFFYGSIIFLGLVFFVDEPFRLPDEPSVDEEDELDEEVIYEVNNKEEFKCQEEEEVKMNK